MSNSNIIMNPNARMINGPVNVIRLEGDVHGVKKILYLFLDYHVSVQNQTQCTNVFSEDVQKYFIDNFYKLNQGSKIYDFFAEIYPSELAENKRTRFIDYKDKYIEEVIKIFKKLFRFDPKKNKVRINELFKNVRLHYLDIRDYYKHNIYFITADAVNIARKFMSNDNIDPQGLEMIIHLLDVMEDHLSHTINVLSKRQTKKNRTPTIIREKNQDVDVETLEYLANKIKNSYKHNDVRNKMLNLINESINNFKKTIQTIKSAITRFESYRKDIMATHDRLTKDPKSTYIYVYGLSSYSVREMIMDIMNTCELLVDDMLVEFYARFTDIYFLRRFLDKDYITNAITYTGALHSNTYVHFLVNEFNFKVTHASYSKIEDMRALTTEIKKRAVNMIQELILPEWFGQCSSLKGFPEEFN